MATFGIIKLIPHLSVTVMSLNSQIKKNVSERASTSKHMMATYLVTEIQHGLTAKLNSQIHNYRLSSKVCKQWGCWLATGSGNSKLFTTKVRVKKLRIKHKGNCDAFLCLTKKGVWLIF